MFLRKKKNITAFVLAVLIFGWFFVGAKNDYRGENEFFSQAVSEMSVSKAKADTFTVRSGHPRIMLTPENLPDVRSRAANQNKSVYTYLKNWADTNFNSTTGTDYALFGQDYKFESGIQRYAFLYALGEISGFDYSAHSTVDYGNKAKALIFQQIAKNDSNAVLQAKYIAIAYDWTADLYSETEKKDIFDWYLNSTKLYGCGSTLKLSDKEHGYRFVAAPCSLYPGLAFYGDGANDVMAQTYVDFIGDYLDSMKAIDHMAGSDGGHAAGLCYSHYSYGTGNALAQDLISIATATNRSIGDIFENYTYMNGYPDWILYGIQPGGPYPRAYSDKDVVTLTDWEDCGSWLWNIEKAINPYVGSSTEMKALKMMSYVSKEKGDLNKAKWINWLVDSRLQSPDQNSVFDIIYNDKSVGADSPGNLGVPTSTAFGWDEESGEIDSVAENPKAGIGHVYMKNSWDPGVNTTHASFISPPYYYFGHQHFSSLAFSIFKGEPLILPQAGAYFYHYEGTYPDSAKSPLVGKLPIDGGSNGGVGFPHQWYFYERTVSTSAPLIMDPSEKIYTSEKYYDGTQQSYKDGGQRSMSDATFSWGDMVPGPISGSSSNDAKEQTKDIGGLIHYEDNTKFTYSAGDATKAYNSVVEGEEYTFRAQPKTSLVQREFVYLKSNGGDNEYFVSFDKIDSVDPTFKKVFQIHTIGEPILNGTETQIHGGNSGGIDESHDTNYVYFNVNNKAKLFLKKLFPNRTVTYKIGGTGTAHTTADINNVDGTLFNDAKIDVPVDSTAEFPDKPIVTIENGNGGVEAFMCDGKNESFLLGCIRGTRYFKSNTVLNPDKIAPYSSYATMIPSHPSGSLVKENYAFAFREADTGAWISHPYDFGEMHYSTAMKEDLDQYGRWALRIENGDDEIHTNFLNVMHPTVDTEKTAMAETLAIESQEYNMKGGIIKDPTNAWAIMFSQDKSQVSIATYVINYDEACNHLITGLVPSVEYSILRNGTELEKKTSSNQGVINFQAADGGTFKLVQTGVTPPDDDTYSVDDVVILLRNFFSRDVLSAADINKDNMLNAKDLGIMMSKWGN